MAIREVNIDSKGNRVVRTLPQYEDKQTTTKSIAKENTMKTRAKITPKITPKAPAKAKASNTPKKEYKMTVMGLTDDNTYEKQHTDEYDESEQLLVAFKKWLNSGEAGEFFAIR